MALHFGENVGSRLGDANSFDLMTLAPPCHLKLKRKTLDTHI